MRIRQYTPNDCDQCRSLWAEMVQRHRDLYQDQTIGGEDPGIEFDTHVNRVGPERVWVAEEGTEILGLVSLIINGEQAEIEPIVVKSTCRRHGIGRALIDVVIHEANRLNILCLSVKPVARNDEALSFFYKSGFRSLGQIELFMWLGASSPCEWKSGLTLLGKSFFY